MSGTSSIPLSMSAAGPVAATPAALNTALIANVAATNPGYTILPAALIEDISSTATGALYIIDQARVDALNGVTPYGANAQVLAQMGQQFGIPQGGAANATVNVVFSGSPGYVIPKGFTVSDGSYQYVVDVGTVIASSGASPQITATAILSGTWAIPAGSVNQIVTSVPSGYTVTVTNPESGTPGSGAESVAAYRSRIMLANQLTSTGSQAYLKTLLYQISGVQQQLVSVQQTSGGWRVICGGGDTYEVAAAILASGIDISTLQGSAVSSGRNVAVSLYQNPDTYSILYVNPPQQTVTVAVIWNTRLPNFYAATSVAQLGAPAIVNYINTIAVGQPINELEMVAAFQAAVANVISAVNITTLEFTVTINGAVVAPAAGTSIINGDPESSFYCAATGVTVTQG